MSQAQRDQEAVAVVKAAVLRLFGDEAIDRIEVFPTEDMYGEAGLSVTVFLREPKATVSGAVWVTRSSRSRRRCGTSTTLASLT